MSLFVQEILAKNETVMIPQPPYSPDMAPVIFPLLTLSENEENHEG